MKKYLSVIIVFTLILSGCSVERTGEFSKESNAIINQKDGYLYYVKRTESFKFTGRNINKSELKSGDIYKIKIDGTGKQKIVEGKTVNPVLYGDYIFYTKEDEQNIEKNTYFCKTDGSDNKIFVGGRTVNIVNVINNIVYYIDNSNTDPYKPKLYRKNISGQDEKLLIDRSFGSVYVDNENIYFIDNTENNNIFKMNTDGSNLRKIIQRGANNFIVDKDKIFYSCYNYINGTQNIIIAEDLKRRMVNDLDIIQKDVAEKSVDGGFYSSDLEGKNEVKLLPDVYTNFYIKDDYVYYTNGSALYKMKKDSSSKIKLITDGSFYDYGITQSSVYHVNSQPNIRLNIYGDYIYYLNNYDKNRLYRIRTDKSGKERVTDERGMGLYLLSEGYIYYYPSSDNGHIYRINVDGTNKIRID